ncbi:MAG: hypothetical protein ACREX3_21050 [Gammaproteobacteria bacterium]
MKAVADIFGFLIAGFGVVSLFTAWRLSGHSLSNFALFIGIFNGRAPVTAEVDKMTCHDMSRLSGGL